MTMIRPETEMKDSGVQWLGNVPKEWNVGKVKHEFYATKTIVGDKVNDYERLALTLNGVIKRSKDAGDGLQPEKFDGYQILKEHELVFKLIDLANVSTSRVGLSPYTGIVSPAYIVLHHRKDMNPRYGEYYFLSMWMNEVFNHIGGDGVRSALNAKDLLNIPYLKVSPDEQQAIADYLDETCSKIDEIIAEAKASIDEYKELKQSVIFEAVTKGLNKNVEMKDSGIEWIGRIPKHWSLVKSNRFITSTQNGISRRDLEKSTGNIVLKLRNITEIGEIDYSYTNRIELSNKEFKNYILQIGDLLFVRVNGSKALVGKCAIFNGNNEPVAYNDHIIRVQINKFCVGEYFKWYLLSQSGKTEIALHINTSAGQYTISGQGLKDIYVSLPPIHEQENIIMFLGNKCKQIDSLIAEKESLINDLEAYKKSLIYEVVTGKRRVV